MTPAEEPHTRAAVGMGTMMNPHEPVGILWSCPASWIFKIDIFNSHVLQKHVLHYNAEFRFIEIDSYGSLNGLSIMPHKCTVRGNHSNTEQLRTS